DKGHVVTSPFVGTFYRKPNPDSPDYVKLGDKVKKGQVLCIVEAMKLMNEIEADIDGAIAAILAEDGAPVEYGQPLFKIA
ncbi:MAG: acetyl-CoA carboxylase biotin carboxyl carrier protein, partial [Kofleriaceae bacterium]